MPNSWGVTAAAQAKQASARYSLTSSLQFKTMPDTAVNSPKGACHTNDSKGSQSNPLLDQLYAQHSTTLVRYLTRLLKNAEDAEDIAQVAYLRLQKIDNAVLDNPRAYLFKIANNLAVDLIRRNKLHINYLQHQNGQQGSPDSPGESGEHLSPERQLSAKQELENIYTAIEQLPLKCRQVFLLHRAKGLAYSEIAREMEISVSSVEKYILQALKQCRETLARNERFAGEKHDN